MDDEDKIKELEERIYYLESLFPKCLNCGKIHREKAFYRWKEFSGFLGRKKKMLMRNNQFCSYECMEKWDEGVEF